MHAEGKPPFVVLSCKTMGLQVLDLWVYVAEEKEHR
jgi:hypothetical protein